MKRKLGYTIEEICRNNGIFFDANCFTCQGSPLRALNDGYAGGMDEMQKRNLAWKIYRYLTKASLAKLGADDGARILKLLELIDRAIKLCEVDT